MTRLNELLHGGVVTDVEINRVRESLLFEEPEKQRKLIRFFCLLVLASTIATCGLLADSVATVIGAMIVAPLMLPIMGIAFGVALGDRKIILGSFVVSILGIIAAVIAGLLITWLFRNIIDVNSNAQIINRTAPRLVDLFAALATGLAGAFATGRRDVSDTLPGVAIAISLVPPLSNVGILLTIGQFDLAWGSMLLFITNYMAILLTGAFMFSIMGYPKGYHVHHSKRTKRTSVAIALILLALIVVPLSATSYKVVQDNIVERRSAIAIKTWLKNSEYRLVSVTAGTDEVRVVITGEGSHPPTAGLKEALQGRLFHLPVALEVVPQTRVRFHTKGSGDATAEDSSKEKSDQK